ncbi:MAG: histidine--tRNA ligase [Thermosphaera sp.]
MSSDYLNPPRGTRDLTGEEALLHEHLADTFRETARLSGFTPIITPTIEYFKLFEAKSGEEIKNSMYVFQDKAGRLLALRPEVTASVVRAYLKHLRSEPKPLRLYYVAQCFRYEEPQQARYREFWQAGLEVIGDPDVNADLSAASAASAFLEKAGLSHYYVVGNVALHRAVMSSMGLDQEAQDHILHLIDKERVGEALRELSSRAGGENAALFAAILDSRLSQVEDVVRDLKNALGEAYERVLSEHSRTVEFIESLESLGYRAEYNPRLVRGLAYYTGLIFEYKAGGIDASVGGGGRYDGLTTVYGGGFEYSTGLALGLDRIALVLSKSFKPVRKRSVMIVLVKNIPLEHGHRVAKTLVNSNVAAYVLRTDSLSKALKLASKKGFDKVVIIGERELAEKSATVKDMATGVQESVKLEELADKLARPG